MWNRFILVLMASLCLGSFSMEALAAHAMAGAEQNGTITYYWVKNKKTVKAAEDAVMANCKKSAREDAHTKPCKLLGVGEGPAYIAIFDTKDGNGMGVSSDIDRQVAIDRAFANCSKYGECPKEASNVVFDEGQNVKATKVVKTTQQSGNCQPPAGKVLRYHDNCFNGACTRTFENGCTKQFQAPYCFDPVQQKWDWKPDGC